MNSNYFGGIKDTNRHDIFYPKFRTNAGVHTRLVMSLGATGRLCKANLHGNFRT